MSVSSILQAAHKLGMAEKLTGPRAPQTAIMLVLGLARPSPSLRALYGFALAESPRMALALSAGLCLVMFSMTFGLERRLQPQKEEAAA
ncbi:MAG: hypothetical protein Q7T84_04365 [Phenylobacterium sp.]|uniref:hypothetical protein n=1 Tax=Phenylobacterium sp. TaxID=1871053 RepID=UPI0027227C27|nr:hypothetical protein [Phenylobacterium sp.]MDO9430516.1 hypothetical protein [Phenylobacterium sp.]